MENFYFAFVRYFSGINNFFSMYSFGKLNLYRIVKGNIAPGESELTYEMLTLNLFTGNWLYYELFKLVHIFYPSEQHSLPCLLLSTCIFV